MKTIGVRLVHILSVLLWLPGFHSQQFVEQAGAAQGIGTSVQSEGPQPSLQDESALEDDAAPLDLADEYLDDLLEQVESAIDLLHSHNLSDHIVAAQELRELAAPLSNRPSGWSVGQADDAALYMGRAAFWLATLSASGLLAHAVPQDTAAALQLLRTAASHGSLEAHQALAYRHATGNYVEKNCTLAHVHLQAVAETWLHDAEDNADTAHKQMPVLLRNHLRDSTHVSEASMLHSTEQIQLEQELANQGHGAFQTEVGYRHLLGLGVPQDAVRAREIFEAAAANGEAAALYNLGVIQEHGLAVPANASRAHEYYKAAADKNMPNGYHGQAALLYDGHGIPENKTRAKELWEAGVALDDPDSTYSLGLVYLEGIAGETPVNKTRAIELLQSAVQLGQWKAPWLLGQLYMEPDLPGGANCSLALQHLWDFVAQRSELSDLSAQAFELLSGQALTPAAHDASDGAVDIKPLSALLLNAYLAEKGAVSAAMNAGWMLERGQGLLRSDGGEVGRVLGMRADAPTAESLRLAAYFYELAARYNTTAAQVDYANLLLSLQSTHRALASDLAVVSADGVLRGSAQVHRALHLYRAAKAAGDVEAATNLAWASVAGVGVQHDLAHAQRLFREAADQAHGAPDGFAPALGLVLMRGVNGLRWSLPRRMGSRFEGWVQRWARAGITLSPPRRMLPAVLRKWMRAAPLVFDGI